MIYCSDAHFEVLLCLSLTPTTSKPMPVVSVCSAATQSDWKATIETQSLTSGQSYKTCRFVVVALVGALLRLKFEDYRQVANVDVNSD